MSGAAPRSGYAAVLSAYESSRDLERRSAKLMSAGPSCWIHGDLTASNVQVALRPALRVSFLVGPVWEIRRGTWPRLST